LGGEHRKLGPSSQPAIERQQVKWQVNHQHFLNEKRRDTMRIAFPADNSSGLDAAINPHFGRCPFFVLVDFQDGKIDRVQTVRNPNFSDHEPGIVPRFIHSQGVNVMVTGGMGWRAVNFFDQLGIRAVSGASGTVRKGLEAFLQDLLDGAAPCRESTQECGTERKCKR
jgi:predicted Fe-Mo cluster-binding NifX family protein